MIVFATVELLAVNDSIDAGLRTTPAQTVKTGR